MGRDGRLGVRDKELEDTDAAGKDFSWDPKRMRVPTRLRLKEDGFLCRCMEKAVLLRTIASFRNHFELE